MSGVRTLLRAPLYKILLLFIEENKLKSELTEKKDEWVVSELTSEEKIGKDVDIQFDLSVPTEGVHITLSSSFYSEGLTVLNME